MEELRVPILRLPHGKATSLPAYHSAHAAGMDLLACPPAPGSAPGRGTGAGDVVIPRGEIRVIPCGFAMAVPVGYEAQVRPRSGLATKHGITMPNTPGTIDADYRGEVMVPLINLGPTDFTVTPGMRIAQMLIKPVPRTTWVEVDELPPTERGAGRFGHTGV